MRQGEAVLAPTLAAEVVRTGWTGSLLFGTVIVMWAGCLAWTLHADLDPTWSALLMCWTMNPWWREV